MRLHIVTAKHAPLARTRRREPTSARRVTPARTPGRQPARARPVLRVRTRWLGPTRAQPVPRAHIQQLELASARSAMQARSRPQDRRTRAHPVQLGGIRRRDKQTSVICAVRVRTRQQDKPTRVRSAAARRSRRRSILRRLSAIVCTRSLWAGPVVCQAAGRRACMTTRAV